MKTIRFLASQTPFFAGARMFTLSLEGPCPSYLLFTPSIQIARDYLTNVAFRTSRAIVFAPDRSSTLIFHSNICPFVNVAPIK
jgi:hypothetical protein